MLYKLAWKNIWRSKIRSGVVITAIALGLWAGIFASAFVNGMMKQKVKTVVDLEISHFQVHEPGFRDEYAAELFMRDGKSILQLIMNDSLVMHASGRTMTMAMMGSASKTGGIRVMGVDPEEERLVTHFDEKVVEGTYFEGMKRNPLLISTRLAEKYKVNLKSKLILTFQDLEGEITAAAFKVVGIFDTRNGLYDQANVFVRSKDLSRLLKLPDGSLHEIAVYLKEHELAESVTQKYQTEFPDQEVLSWLDLGLGMRYMVESMGLYTTIVVGIILIALLFSIVNTMLMAVLERTRELGMLMAVGMKKSRIFLMIMLETVFLSAVGTPLGFLFSYFSIWYFGSTGINLGSAGYEDYGFGNMVFPYLESSSYIEVTVMVVIMSILAAVYPARKALSLNPVEAIRKT